ncbi:MAG: TlyA family RNA methyltransferase [Deltaproteobacteria bacterium]|nr:TlyA family RNA methyltransferase [Deltaproteobacteria bacterium]
MKARVDLLLVQRGLITSRERARSIILAGKVFSGARRVDKAGEQLSLDAPLEVRGGDHPYVSRGGVKLQGALEAFGYDPKGFVAIDVGASTGGFADCLLQRGARKVYTVDVGYGQLHDKLRRDHRVVVMERTNARYLKPEELPETIDLAVVDVSFIGLEKILGPVASLLRRGGDLLALVKPQFEVSRKAVGKGGVVRDQKERAAAIRRVEELAVGSGLSVLGHSDAVIKGPKGNQEHFIWLRKTGNI